MANELQAATAGQTGLTTTYFVLWNSVGQVWNGTAFATSSAANRNAGAIAAIEAGTASGVYMADAPVLAAGVYSYSLYRRLGGSPAESDTLLCGPGSLEWSGSSVASISGLPASIVAYDIGNGRTVGYFLQGGANLVTESDDGQEMTIYQTDDESVLVVLDNERFPLTVGGLRGVAPRSA